MIETVVVYDKNGSDSLTLTMTNPEMSQGFAIVDMTGLGPGSATVSTSDWVTIPGSRITSVKHPKRTITLQLRFIEGVNGSIESIRRSSYVYFPLGALRTLAITSRDYYTNEEKTFLIDGVISRNEPPIWSKEEGTTIEFVCGDPMFRDKETEQFDFDSVKPVLHFESPDNCYGQPYPVGEILDTRERTINVESLVEIGASVILTARGDVTNPYIFNRTTNQAMLLNYTLHRGDTVRIDTRPGYKSIKLLEGVGVNLINYLAINSKWITLKRGENNIGIRCESGIQNLDITFVAQPLYAGI